MKRSCTHNRFHRICLLVFLLCPFVAQGEPREEKDLAEAASGRTAVIEPLTEGTFVPVVARRFKNARVLWVNWQYLAEKGFKVPAEGLTPEFEARILDHFAYGIPGEGQEAHFTDRIKLLDADIYGGDGIGWAKGSGRAASSGEYQNKGLGITSLVDTVENKHQSAWQRLTDFFHRNGGVSTAASANEAEWGEVFNAEAPYGGNRVVFVIGTGTSTHFGPFRDPRSLIIRENSIRPAHFLVNSYIHNPSEAERPLPPAEVRGRDEQRLFQLHATLPDLLPPVEGDALLTPGERYRARLLGIADRYGRFFSTLYVKQFLHGSVTPSNIELDGRAIDYGTATALNGFPLARTGRNLNGSVSHVRLSVLQALFDHARGLAPNELKPFVPTNQEMERALDAAFADQTKREFLWLAGTPPELLDTMMSHPEATSFAALLKRFAAEGNDEVRKFQFRVPKDRGRISLPKLLAALSADEGDEALRGAGLREEEIAEAKQQYRAFKARLEKAAEAHGVGSEALTNYLAQAVAKRTYVSPRLIQGPMKQVRVYSKILLSMLFPSSQALQKDIDRTVAEAVRTYPDTEPFTVVLEERKLGHQGALVRRVYDAKDNSTRLDVQLNADNATLRQLQAGDTLDVMTGSKRESARLQFLPGRVRFALGDRPLEGFEVKVEAERLPAIRLSASAERVSLVAKTCADGYRLILEALR